MTGRGDGAEEEAGGPATEEVAGRRAPRRIPFPFLVLALAILATLVRLPYLQQIPRFTDEWDDTETALAIAREPGHWPLISNDHYNGPVFHYLLAAGYRLGADLTWTRLLALLCGVAAVAATAGLARSLGLLALAGDGITPRRVSADHTDRPDRVDRAGPSGLSGRADRAGLIAGLLMATSFIPVVVGSHIGWSNSTTPLWTTLFLWILVESLRRNEPRLLPIAGLAGGLAQQTHPSVLAILLGAALWTALCRPHWLRGRWPWLAVLAAALAMTNVIAFNLLSAEGGSLAMAKERDYAFSGRLPGTEAYLQNVRGAARLGWQMLGSSFQATVDETTDAAGLRRVMGHPGALATCLTALLAMAALARRRVTSLPALLWLAALLVLPIFNQAWHHYILARYLAPLLPPSFAAMGLLLAAGHADPRAAMPFAAAERRSRSRSGRSILALVWTLVLVLHPIVRIRDFYAGELAAHKTNARLWQLGEALPAHASAQRPVWLDYELRFQRSTAGGNVYRTMKGFMDAAEADYEKVKLDQPPPVDLPAGTWLLLGDARAAELKAAGLDLAPADLGRPLAPAAPGGYGVWEAR